MGMASAVVFAVLGAGLAGKVAVVTDGQLSGLTNVGITVAEVAPEAAAGGPIGLVENGDIIAIDVAKRFANLEVPDDELAKPARAPHQMDDDRRAWLACHLPRSGRAAGQGAYSAALTVPPNCKPLSRARPSRVDVRARGGDDGSGSKQENHGRSVVRRTFGRARGVEPQPQTSCAPSIPIAMTYRSSASRAMAAGSCAMPAMAPGRALRRWSFRTTRRKSAVIPGGQGRFLWCDADGNRRCSAFRCRDSGAARAERRRRHGAGRAGACRRCLCRVRRHRFGRGDGQGRGETPDARCRASARAFHHADDELQNGLRFAQYAPSTRQTSSSSLPIWDRRSVSPVPHPPPSTRPHASLRSAMTTRCWSSGR